MIIPWNTDAPLYHYPIATVSLIVVNIFCFLLMWGSIINEARGYKHDAAPQAPENEQQAPAEQPKDQGPQQQNQPQGPAPGQNDEVMPGDDPDEGADPREQSIGLFGATSRLVAAAWGQDDEQPEIEWEGVDVDPNAAAEGDAEADPDADLVEYIPPDWEPMVLKRFALQFGEGLNPIQWISCMFLHGGIFHLIGNMIFLWTFGLIVEGKLGWWKFLLAYLCIGALQHGIEQSMSFWFNEGSAIGASGAIFGLMAICLVWAPMNEVSVLMFIGLRPFAFDVQIWILALIFIVIDALVALITGLKMSTEMLHTMGAVMGFAVGVAFVKLNWVDCEGWDMFGVMAGTHIKETAILTRRPDKSKMKWSEDEAEAAPAGAEESEGSRESRSKKSAAGGGGRRQKVYAKLKKFLHDGHLEEAQAEYEMLKELRGELEEPEHLKLIELLLADKQTAEAVPLMEEYLEKFDSQATVMRLKLARVLIAEHRPKVALKVLKAISGDELTPQLKERYTSLVAKAKQMLTGGAAGA